MTRKIPSTEDKEKAKRLKAIWNQRKGALGLTQIKAAQQLNIKQPTFSQYINSVIPLNTDMILRFASLLEVSPVQIDPALKNVDSLSAFRPVQVKAINVPLIGSTSGNSVMNAASVLVPELPQEGVYAGVAVDDARLKERGIPKGSTVIVDLDQSPVAINRQVIARIKGGDAYRAFLFQHEGRSAYRMKDIEADFNCSIPKNQVLAMHLIYSITMP